MLFVIVKQPRDDTLRSAILVAWMFLAPHSMIFLSVESRESAVAVYKCSVNSRSTCCGLFSLSDNELDNIDRF